MEHTFINKGPLATIEAAAVRRRGGASVDKYGMINGAELARSGSNRVALVLCVEAKLRRESTTFDHPISCLFAQSPECIDALIRSMRTHCSIP